MPLGNSTDTHVYRSAGCRPVEERSNVKNANTAHTHDIYYKYSSVPNTHQPASPRCLPIVPQARGKNYSFIPLFIVRTCFLATCIVPSGYNVFGVLFLIPCPSFSPCGSCSSVCSCFVFLSLNVSGLGCCAYKMFAQPWPLDSTIPHSTSSTQTGASTHSRK